MKGHVAIEVDRLIIYPVLFIAAVVIIGKHYLDPIIENGAQVHMDVQALQQKLDIYRAHGQRIEDMEETLCRSYRLTRHEAHYYSIVFDEFSRLYNIPWEIYAATMRAESNFDPTVRSKKGAIGLMQVMPRTAKEVCKKLEIRYEGTETLWNDIHNMAIGITYLSDAIKDKGLKYGIRVYIGGPDFLRHSKKNKNTKKYVGEYKTAVWLEYDRLRMSFQGVQAERKKERSFGERPLFFDEEVAKRAERLKKKGKNW